MIKNESWNFDFLIQNLICNYTELSVFIFNKQIVEACSEDKEGCEDLPVKTCLDAKGGVIVVEVIDNLNNSIEVNGECVVIEGDARHMLIVTEKIKIDSALWKLKNK